MSAFEHAYAVVIGVASYPTRDLPTLPLAVLNDAVDVACALWNPALGGYRADRVRLLLDEQATERGIRRELDWLANASTDQDTVIIFFSGHGWHDDSGSYLAAHDAQLGSPLGGVISGEDLTGYLQEIRADRLVVFLDCCYAGGIAEVKGRLDDRAFSTGIEPGFDERAYAKLASGAGRVLFAASQPGALSIVLERERNSVFTECLLRALRGEAGRAGNDTIGILDIFQFVTHEVVKKSCGLQKPLFKAVMRENFPLVLRPREPQWEAESQDLRAQIAEGSGSGPKNEGKKPDIHNNFHFYQS